MAYDFYKFLRNDDGTTRTIPSFKLSRSNTDKKEVYRLNDYSTRLDVLADRFYSDPSLSKLILMANPIYRNEFEIPDGAILRIPFPKNRVIKEYEDKVRLNNEL